MDAWHLPHVIRSIEILKIFHVLRKIESIYQDCGLLIFDGETQDTHSGGSGCGCSASVLAAYILPELAKGTWKKVLFVPTGALLSKTSFNEGDSIPGIAHAVILEHVSKKDQKQ